MWDRIGLLLLGSGVGIMVYQIVITVSLGRYPMSMCDWCEFRRKKSRHEDGGKSNYSS